ncbi:HIT family protein [Terrihabitans rhizophilus]|uniref:HIT family protein n=1 Tax=Terrihabitans rhizophilus TaxID=3092662 RepID=A0ABU4RIW5_9HYPH|nr:HIT family protein [Terrihabitans sp. PJ23]MDX6804491.1 HIT family protein [Terrihabitans sp. PJ23]
MTEDLFSLHPRLAADTAIVTDLALSRVLLMDDARFPWLILVPRRAGAVEIIDLDAAAQARLMEEIALASRALRAVAPCDKLNVGALGNVVSQLHVHVVSRVEGDPAWPGPVWGSGKAKPYDQRWQESLVQAIRLELGRLEA